MLHTKMFVSMQKWYSFFFRYLQFLCFFCCVFEIYGLFNTNICLCGLYLWHVVLLISTGIRLPYCRIHWSECVCVCVTLVWHFISLLGVIFYNMPISTLCHKFAFIFLTKNRLLLTKRITWKTNNVTWEADIITYIISSSCYLID